VPEPLGADGGANACHSQSARLSLRVCASLFHQALSRADEADALREQWEAAYLQAFPVRIGVATFFVMAPGPGACCV
jgi:hypothetical protein